MDNLLRTLEREAYSTGDIDLLTRLYQRLRSLDEPSEKFIRLKQYIIAMLPDDSDNSYDISLVKLAREVSKHLVGRGYDFYTDTLTERWDYDNPPVGASNWAFVEFNETRLWSADIINNIVALTGVYLVDTGTNWHLASSQRSVWLDPAYANIIDVVHTSDEDEDEINHTWYIDNNGNYINRSALGNAISWHWITEEDLEVVIEDLGDVIENNVPGQTHAAIADVILGYYAGNPPL